MQVIIIIRKEVSDSDQARDTYNEVKVVCCEIEGLKFTANYSNHFEPVET